MVADRHPDYDHYVLCGPAVLQLGELSSAVRGDDTDSGAWVRKVDCRLYVVVVVVELSAKARHAATLLRRVGLGHHVFAHQELDLDGGDRRMDVRNSVLSQQLADLWL